MIPFQVYTWRSLFTIRYLATRDCVRVCDSLCFCVFSYTRIRALSTLCLMAEGFCNYTSRLWVTEALGAAVSVYAWLRPRPAIVLQSAAPGPWGHEPTPHGHHGMNPTLLFRVTKPPHCLQLIGSWSGIKRQPLILSVLCVILTFTYRNNMRILGTCCSTTFPKNTPWVLSSPQH